MSPTGSDGALAPVVLLTGPPGAGKSTIAPLLADELDPSVHLHADDFWACIRTGAVLPYLPEAQRQNEVVIDVLVGAAFGYAAGGYHVIVDGVVGPWFLELFRVAARAAGRPLHYAVLRPQEQEVVRRATGRTAENTLTEPEPVREMHRQFSDLGELEHHVLDSTDLAPRATADRLLLGIARGAFRLGT
ncbi:AAA family ATPase [Saccharopolyspora griseoalba]|uniref:AAA family ATPase n=1 Tax=Saccharopolyspora griseoalba TaxID=1431848 RepID=A0ABW2LGK4_9PSEU